MEVYANETYQVMANHEEHRYDIINMTTSVRECESRYLPEAVDIANNLEKECKRVFEAKPTLNVVH